MFSMNLARTTTVNAKSLAGSHHDGPHLSQTVEKCADFCCIESLLYGLYFECSKCKLIDIEVILHRCVLSSVVYCILFEQLIQII